MEAGEQTGEELPVVIAVRLATESEMPRPVGAASEWGAKPRPYDIGGRQSSLCDKATQKGAVLFLGGFGWTQWTACGKVVGRLGRIGRIIDFASRGGRGVLAAFYSLRRFARAPARGALRRWGDAVPASRRSPAPRRGAQQNQGHGHSCPWSFTGWKTRAWSLAFNYSRVGKPVPLCHGLENPCPFVTGWKTRAPLSRVGKPAPLCHGLENPRPFATGWKTRAPLSRVGKPVPLCHGLENPRPFATGWKTRAPLPRVGKPAPLCHCPRRPLETAVLGGTRPTPGEPDAGTLDPAVPAGCSTCVVPAPSGAVNVSVHEKHGRRRAVNVYGYVYGNVNE
jgi:hypothetical protein